MNSEMRSVKTLPPKSFQPSRDPCHAAMQCLRLVFCIARCLHRSHDLHTIFFLCSSGPREGSRDATLA